MPGTSGNPVRLDHYQNIVEVHWTSPPTPGFDAVYLILRAGGLAAAASGVVSFGTYSGPGVPLPGDANHGSSAYYSAASITRFIPQFGNGEPSGPDLAAAYVMNGALDRQSAVTEGLTAYNFNYEVSVGIQGYTDVPLFSEPYSFPINLFDFSSYHPVPSIINVGVSTPDYGPDEFNGMYPAPQTNADKTVHFSAAVYAAGPVPTALADIAPSGIVYLGEDYFVTGFKWRQYSPDQGLEIYYLCERY